MTTIGFTPLGTTPPRTATRTVPLRPRSSVQPQDTTTSADRAVPRVRPTAPTGWVRVGSVRLVPALGYLLAWAGVLFAVLLTVLLAGYLALYALGVVTSVSKALAIILGEPLADSEVLPALQPQAVIPLAVVASFLLAVLAFAAGFAALLVHNAVSSLSGGLLVRMRAVRAPSAPTRGRHAAASAHVDLRRSGDS